MTRLGRCGLRTTNRALSSLEHGTGLDVAKLPELAAALDCTVTYLIGLTDDPHRWDPDDEVDVPRSAATRRMRGVDRGSDRPPTTRSTAAASLILGADVPDRSFGRRWISQQVIDPSRNTFKRVVCLLGGHVFQRESAVDQDVGTGLERPVQDAEVDLAHDAGDVDERDVAALEHFDDPSGDP